MMCMTRVIGWAMRIGAPQLLPELRYLLLVSFLKTLVCVAQSHHDTREDQHATHQADGQERQQRPDPLSIIVGKRANWKVGVHSEPLEVETCWRRWTHRR